MSSVTSTARPAPQIPDVRPNNHQEALIKIKELLDFRSDLAGRAGDDYWITKRQVINDLLEETKSDLRVKQFFNAVIFW